MNDAQLVLAEVGGTRNGLPGMPVIGGDGLQAASDGLQRPRLQENKGLAAFPEKHRLQSNARRSVQETFEVMGIGRSNVRVQVNGTTFAGIYEVVGPTVELTSADFGDRSAGLGGEDPRTVAVRMLRAMAEEAMRSSATPFLRDDGTVAAPAEATGGSDS